MLHTGQFLHAPWISNLPFLNTNLILMSNSESLAVQDCRRCRWVRGMPPSAVQSILSSFLCSVGLVFEAPCSTGHINMGKKNQSLGFVWLNQLLNCFYWVQDFSDTEQQHLSYINK